jgi:transposase
MDEASFYRQPTQASLYAPRGREQPAMRYASCSNTVMRVGGFLDAVDGRVFHWEAKKITAKLVAKWWTDVAKAYPQAHRVFIVMDNWPVHHHPHAKLAAIRDPRIRLLPLPTYSPWLNPIEKLWRSTRQAVAHAHPLCDDFLEFRRQVNGFLDSPMPGRELLKYVGLSLQ